MDPHKKKKRSKVTPSDERGGLINSSFELDVNSDPAHKDNGSKSNHLHESMKAAVDKTKLLHGFRAVVDAKNAASKWQNYTRTKRLRKQKNGLHDNDENESSAVGGIGLDTEVDQKSPFQPFGETKVKQTAEDRSLIDYFARLGKSKDPNEVIDLNFVDTLIRNGANINCADKHGQTLLHEVSRTWHIDVAKFLIEKKVNINSADKYGRTPLHVAAAVDYPEMVELLIKNGAEKEKKSKDGQTPVHFAAKNDAVMSLKMLIKKGCLYDEVKDYRGRTPLFVAAELDRSESARFLLEMDANVKIPDNNGQKALSWMITKMPPVAEEALKQFHMTDRPNRKQYFELQHLVQATAKESSQTPLMCAVQFKQYDIITNKVMVQLLNKMWIKYARFRVWLNLFLNFIYIILWSVLGVLIEYDKRHEYILPDHWWRIVLLLAAIGFTIWQIIEEVLEFKRSLRTNNEWVRVRKKNIEDDLEYCHPRWPEERAFLETELQSLEEGGPKYFSDMWNWFDYLCYAFLVACIVTHLVDIIHHSSMLALAHIRIMSVTIILLWFRILKIVRAFSLLGPFIVMLSHMAKDLVRFIFLYMDFYIPFVFAFWMIFGGDKTKYEDLGKGSGAENVTVSGYGDFGQVMFSLFRLTLVDDYPYDEMRSVDPIMTNVLVGCWLALSAILCLNLLIALLSDTFQRVYDNAQANAVMQKAITTTNVWEGLSVSSRAKFLKHISRKCAPLQMYYDDDMTEGGDEDLQKVTIQIKEDLDDLREKWHDQFGSIRRKNDDDDDDGDDNGDNRGTGGQKNVSIEKFESEVESLRKGIKEMQAQQEDLLKIYKRDMSVIKSLLCEVTGRSADEMEEPPEVSESQEGDKVKKLKKKKKRKTAEPVALAEPLFEPPVSSSAHTAPMVDVSTVDFSSPMIPHMTRTSSYPTGTQDPSTEC